MLLSLVVVETKLILDLDSVIVFDVFLIIYVKLCVAIKGDNLGFVRLDMATLGSL